MTRRHARHLGLAAVKFLLLLGVLILSGKPDGSYAQGKTTEAKGKSSANNMDALLSILDLKVNAAEKELEDRVRRIVGSQMDTPYSQYVKITVDRAKFAQKLKVFEVSSKLRTLPSAATEGAGRYVRGLSVEDVFALIKSVKVSLTIDKSVSNEQEANLKKSISAALNLKSERGDVVEVERSDMMSASIKSKQEAFNREQQNVAFQNKKLEMMLREMELQNRALANKGKDKMTTDQLALEIRRISDDIKELRDSNERELRLLQEKTAQMQQKTQKEEKTQDPKYEGQLGKVKKWIEGLELPLTLLPLGLLFALVFLKMAGGQGKTAGALKLGLEELGKSVQSMAETLAGAAKTISASSANESNTGKGAAQSAQQAEPARTEGGAIELLQADAVNTWQLLIGMPYFLLSVMKDWLNEAENREAFLQVTEAVGAEAAAWIWSRFPAEEIEQLGPLLIKPISKTSAFSAVSLLYRAAVREAGTKPLFVREMAELDILITLTDQKLADALSASDDVLIATILALLTPQRAVRVMGKMGERITVEVIKEFEKIPSVPAQEAQRRILLFKSSAEKLADTAGAQSLLTCLVRVLESSDGAMQVAARQYLTENAQMAVEVRKRVITFDDVMGLDADSLFDIFGAFSPTDTASLVTGLKAEHREKILKIFSGKARMRVDEEIKKIESKKNLKKQAGVQAQRLKASTLRRVRVMRDQGLIEFESSQKPDAKNAGVKKAS
ncbi:MAG: hypothetical protein RIR26_198 [Pseudomonadota bacterium]